ncbi:hypothetical protein V6N12_076387 [Hibiscus sabdariffa]|uniref:Reverse transcriptase zinc-binding domain-containing protein n=1 Tax=Hibiscus sabdariffa TaxID=183260 RepID=A0ABR2D9M6_9ROSI
MFQEEVFYYFPSLFLRDNSSTYPFPINGAFSRIDDELMQSLVSVPSNNEVLDALMDMAPLKSQVLHRRAKCSDYDFVLVKMCAWLNGWATRTLSVTSRITLAKLVLLAILVYFMQPTMLLKKVQLLRQKYKVSDLFSNSIHQPNYTLLWRALAKYWNVLRNGIIWSLDNGTSAHPLIDVWVLSTGPLKDYMTSDALLFLIGFFSDLLDNNGNWDRDKLCTIFHLM